MMEIGSRIYSLRKGLGLTLEEVGNYVGVGKSTVRKWESGQIANMRRDKIARLAEVLQTSPSYLMGWTEKKEQPALSDKDELWNALSSDPLRLRLARWLCTRTPEQLKALSQILLTVESDQ